MKLDKPKYIFVTGGVASSLGKGIISASVARLLQARGYSVTVQKFDPYLNVDPGTLNPYEHGECYVTDDICFVFYTSVFKTYIYFIDMSYLFILCTRK